MSKLKAYIERINNQLKNKELLPKKVWMYLSKSHDHAKDPKKAVVDMIPVKESNAHYILVLARI